MCVPLNGRIASTTNSAGQSKTLLWLSLLPLGNRIQSDEIAAVANGNSSAPLSDNYSLNNGDSDVETTRPRPGVYPVLLPLYPAMYVGSYAPVPLRQPYLPNAADEDTLIRAEFIKGVLEGLQGPAATPTFAVDMKTTSDKMENNKLLKSSSRKISENTNERKNLKRRKLPFVLLDDEKLAESVASKNTADTERIYNIYEVHVV